MFELLSYPFFLRALIAAALTSITCGIIGTYIVSRRIVFIGGGISHASFGGIGIGYYAGFNPVAGAAVFAVLCAFAIEALAKKTRMGIDALIGVIWSLGMAVGIIFIFITPGYAPDLMSYLFGSILTVSYEFLFVMSGLTILVLLFFFLLFKEILFIAFDEEYAVTQGIPVKIINYLLLSLIALTIVINIKVVGIILVISLLTTPQITARLFTNDFGKIIFYSILFGLLSCFSGLIVSYYLEIPSGASIIFSSIIIFIIMKIIRSFAARIQLNRRININS